jgi:plastocyanin
MSGRPNMKVDITKLPVVEGVVLFLLVALAVAFIGAFSATSGDDGEEADDNGVASETPVDDGDGNGTPSGGDIVVSMGDNFFDPNDIVVAASDSVTFQLTNDGNAIHNMRVAGDDDEYNTGDDTVSDPEVFSGGDTGTLAWTAPDSAAEVLFRCDFHPVDMIGTITVE